MSKLGDAQDALDRGYINEDEFSDIALQEGAITPGEHKSYASRGLRLGGLTEGTTGIGTLAPQPTPAPEPKKKELFFAPPKPGYKPLPPEPEQPKFTLAAEALIKAVRGAQQTISLQPIKNVAEQLATSPTIQRKAGAFTAGAVSTVTGLGGAARALGLETIGNSISKASEKIAREFMPPDPTFADQVAAGFGSMATFFVPGLGVQAGAVKLAAVSPRLAAWFGIGASSVLEAAVEGGAAYNESLSRGMAKDQAFTNANKVFWSNLPVLAITNRLGIFGEKGGIARKVLSSALFEGSQEASQEIISNIALNDPIFHGVLTAGGIGAIVGGGVTSIMGLLEKKPGTSPKDVMEMLVRSGIPEGKAINDTRIATEMMQQFQKQPLEAIPAPETPQKPLLTPPQAPEAAPGRVIPPPTVPEAPQTILLQLQAVQRGRIGAVLIPPREQAPGIPEGFGSLKTEVGTWIYDPKQIKESVIAEKVNDGTYGELLGHLEPKPPEGQPSAVVTAKVGEVEAKTSVVSPQRAPEQAEELKRQFPEATVEIGGPEKASEILVERQEKQIEKIPQEIGEKPKPAPETQLEKQPAKKPGGINVQNVPIKFGREGQTAQIDGKAFGNLLVHKSLQGKTYTLTHIPTGLALSRFFRNKTDAGMMAEALQNLDLGFTDPKKASPEIMKMMADAIREYERTGKIPSEPLTTPPTGVIIPEEKPDVDIPRPQRQAEPSPAPEPGPTGPGTERGAGVPPLEGVPAETIPPAQGERRAERVPPEGRGEDRPSLGRDGEQTLETGLQPPAGAGHGLGAGAGGVAAPEARGGRPGGAGNYRITDADQLGAGTPSQKYSDNIRAIKLLKELEASGRKAIPEDQAILVRYVGWGGMPQVFDQDNDKFTKKFKELESLLSPEEYEAARASTPNAHYTSPQVIQGIYAALERLGSKSGRILEPAMGTGNFFGLLPQGLSGSSLVGIELDSITGRIAQQLYPGADIRISGFEAQRFPDNFFDLVIGNVPFGDYKVHDPQYNKLNFNIHNYFFAKAIDKVRPGGVLAFVTSHYTLDEVSSSVWQYISDRADLVGAIRLPSTAFKQTAGTEVVTDVIFLRKRLPGEKSSGTGWLKSVEQDIRGKTYHLNQYFVDNPQMMLGVPALEGTMYRANEFTLKPDGRDLAAAIQEAVERLPKDVISARQPVSEVKDPRERIPAPEEVKQGGLVVQSGMIMQKVGTELVEALGVSVARVKGLIKVRDAVRDLMRIRLDPASQEEAVTEAQKDLSRIYDDFVSKLGAVSSKENKRAFRLDPDYHLLSSLEKVDLESGKVSKADIFTKRVAQPVKNILRTDTAKDALNVSLSELGRVDLARIGALAGKTEQEIRAELKGLIYNDPEKGWVPAEEYLSGDVKKKLKVAKDLKGPEYQENAAALEAVQPEDLKPGDIEARLGASWIPPDQIERFLANLTEVNLSTFNVSHVPVLASWTVELTHGYRYELDNSVGNNSTWGTNRIDAVSLVELALNGKIPTITDRSEEGSVVNRQATEAAREKQFQIKQRFAAWIWEVKIGHDQKTVDELLRIYNDVFNNIRLRSYDGSHLVLPGINPDIEMRPAQKDAVWRILHSPNTLLAHAVGAGKTYTMIAAGMEMRRIGLRKKPMYVVPNHLVEQWAGEFLKLYPGANILVTQKEDFEKDNRKKLMSRIATGDWDAVVVAHSSFTRLPMSEEAIQEFMHRQLQELEDAIRATRQEEGRRSRSVKEMEKTKKRLEAKLQARLDREHKDPGVTFEELGVDQLFVDEAQQFKNLFFVTKMQRIAGLPQTDSLRAFDLFLKIQYLQRLNNGAGVTFATGTPISNTIAEMFTMQRYLSLAAMKEDGIDSFDAWASNFGDVVTRLELSPDGSSYKVRSAFAKFVNLPELMNRFLLVADVKTAEMLKLPRPELKGGKATEIVSPGSEELKAYVQGLVERAEAVRGGGVDPSVDNMLKITTDGRKAALDMRLVDPNARDHPDSKVNRLVDRVHEVWKETKAKKLTQLVFIDLSTPAKGKFNVYDDVRGKLVALGIPRKDVVFIHEAETQKEKQELFDKVNSGQVRILLGSTGKMGVGMNVQRLLVAEHQLDAPWRPDEVEQRDGRILRQSNSNLEVQIFRYVTKGSFDAYMWQTLERKARFIDQVMSGKLNARSAEDVEGRALTFEEMKAAASDNPLIIEKIRTDVEVQRLQILQGAYKNARFEAQRDLVFVLKQIAMLKAMLPKYEADLAALKAGKPEKFTMEVEGKRYDKKEDAGAAVIKIARELTTAVDQQIGSYNGFPLWVSVTGVAGSETVYAQGQATRYRGNVSDNPAGTVASLDHYLSPDWMQSQAESIRKDIATLEKKLEDTHKELTKSFEHQGRLEELLRKQTQLDEQLNINKGETNTEQLEEKEEPETGETEAEADGEEEAAAIGEFGTQAESQTASDIGIFAKDVPVRLGSMGTIRPMEMPEMVKLARELGVRFKIGKLPKSAGLFKGIGKGLIKLDYRIFADPEQAAKVLAHEVGHFVDWFAEEPDVPTLKRGNIIGRLNTLTKFLKGTFGDKAVTNAEFRKELIAVSEMWRPYDKEQASQGFLAYRNSAVELYADALSVLFNTPGTLEQMAPKFYKEFFETLDKKSAVKEAFFTLQDFLAGRPESILEGRESDFRHGFARAEELSRLKRQERELRDKRTWERLQQEYQDAFYPIIKKVEEAEARGEDIPDEDNPKFILDELDYYRTAQQAWMNQIDWEVTKRLKEAEMTIEDLGLFLSYTRIANERKDLANPYGHTQKTAEAGLQHLLEKLGPEKARILQESAARFHDLVFQVGEEAVEVGSYNKETFDTTIRPNKENYATFAVVDYFVEQGFISPGIKGQRGTLSEILNPFTATIVKTLGLIRLNALQRARNSVRNFLQEFYPGEIEKARPINPQDQVKIYVKKPGQGLLEMLEDGRRAAYHVDPFIAEAFTRYGPGRLNIAVRLLRLVQRGIFHPLLITYNPFFSFYSNPLRDFQRTWKLLPNTSLVSLLWEQFKAIPNAVRRQLGVRDDLIEEMVREKVLDIPFLEVHLEQEEDIYSAQLERLGLLENPRTLKERLRKTLVGRGIGLLMSAIRFPGSVIESLPKIAGYNLRKKGGESGYRLAFNTRNYTGTPNFRKGGLYTQTTNAVFMFSNIALQGLRTDYRTAKDPTTRSGYWFKTATTVLTPKLFMFLAAAGYLGKELKDYFDRMTEYDKTNYITIPLGKQPGGLFGWKTVYQRIPLDDSGRLVGAIFWKMLNAFQKKGNPGQIQQILDVGSDILPNFNPAITILAQWSIYLTGKNPYDAFRGRTLLPETEFKAGGWPALKRMIEWTANQSGLVSAAHYDPARRTTYEAVMQTVPLINRIFKISDYGMIEQQRGDLAVKEQERAEVRTGRLPNTRSFLRERYLLQERKQSESASPEHLGKLRRYNGFYNRAVARTEKRIQELSERGERELVAQEQARLEKNVESWLKNNP